MQLEAGRIVAELDPEYLRMVSKVISDIYGDATSQMIRLVASRLAKGLDVDDSWATRKLLELVDLRAQITEVIEQLDGKVATSVAELMDAVAAKGAKVAATELAVTGSPLSATSTRAVEALARQTVDRLTGTHSQILRGTLDVYRQVVAEVSAPGVVTGTVTRRQAAQRAVDRWARQGVTGFVDRAGRNWEIESYAEMTTRTAGGRAMMEGSIDQYQAEGRNFVIVSDSPEECSVCLVPGTVVEGPVATGLARLEYVGDIISIVTASGNHLAGTPDHAVLTPLGWRTLQDLQPGDQVISDDRQQGHTRVVPDHVQMPTVIEEAGESGAPILLAGPTRRDLDQNRAYREIRGVRTNHNLLAEGLPSFGQPTSELGFVLGLGALLGSDDSLDLFGGFGATSACVMCAVEHRRSLLGTGFGPSTAHGSGSFGTEDSGVHGVEAALKRVMAGASLYASATQVLGNRPTADTEGGAELLRSLTGHVAVDEVVSVGWRKFRGHVWDLSTRPRWFLANGIVTHNCRPFEGKGLSLDGSGIGTKVGGILIVDTLRGATSKGLFHVNCRHRVSPIVPGRTKPMTHTADPEGDQQRQRQRALERRIRAAKRQVQAAAPFGDSQELTRAKQLVANAQADMRTFIADTDRKRLSAREQIGRAR